MEQLSTKELVEEVAKRHGIVLDDKDPILVTLTLNELIIENYVKAVEGSISKINARQIEIAKLVGEEIVTKGALYLRNEIGFYNGRKPHNVANGAIHKLTKREEQIPSSWRALSMSLALNVALVVSIVFLLLR